MSKLISIIIATFNVEKCIKDCLDSIVSQKNEDVELLIIDGGSSDATLTILKDYCHNIDYYISEKDSGIYDAWNKGIAKAGGEWILFLGADDRLEDGSINYYINYLNSNATFELDYISAKNIYVDPDGRRLKVIGEPWHWKQFRITMRIAHVASLHRRKLYNEVGLYDLRFKICGDYELLLRKKQGLRCQYINVCVAKMAIGGSSYSIAALSEAHIARSMHSGFSKTTLISIYIYQIILYLRHKVCNTIFKRLI